MRIQSPGTPAPRIPTARTDAPAPAANTVRSPASGAPAARARDTFEPGKAQGAVPAARSNAARNLPAEIPTGTPDYYRQRADDFRRRNPGMEPPAYYMEYGQKYCDRFSSLGPKDLTPEGLAWRDRTLDALQSAIETKRMEDPAGFAQLERDPEAFKRFAYDSHPDAYVDSGLYKLPVQDLMKIGTTPDIKDLLTKDGVRQVIDALGKMSPGDAAKVAKESAKELVHDVKDFFSGLKPPKINLPHLSLPW
ncbi:hypothetical protein [Archangium primigenium]|uniref:hypothetical protein n=1 Tax=[Archangium] primigenium TaxID=2792470 RepID=UPI001956F754|nr:hypothetical protein [Archangium primigenium]MBM7118843.1 hypothetical protein [Archangium primigenium]